MTTAESSNSDSRGDASQITSLACDPAWLPHRIIDGDRAFRFVHAPRDVHRGVTFLDDEYLDPALPRVDALQAELAAAAIASEAPAHFIFHSAFARSTLLARALDLPGQAIGLKEPIILNDAIALARARRLSDTTLDLLLKLLGRPFAEGETVIIKPSSIVTPLASSLLRLRPKARAILMERPLPEFLRSIAAKGMFGRIWARRQLAFLRPHAPFDAGFSSDDFLFQTDLQAAAFAWLIQRAQFAALARAMPERVRALCSEDLVTDRVGTLVEIGRWFGLGIERPQAVSIAAGPAFARHSKTLGNLSEETGGQQPSPYEAEIGMVSEWITAVAQHVGVSLDHAPAWGSARQNSAS